jgi:phosphoribosylanthranilate isomerase
VSVKVKICGITNGVDATAAVAAGADLLGFNFYSGSPRYVDPATAAAIIRALPTSAQTVGVFVNATRSEVERTAAATGIRLLQFHGDETPELCRGWPYPVIKAVRIRDAHSLRAMADHPASFLLADAFVEGAYGGTGQRVALERLIGVDPQRLILAGGLTPENIESVLLRIRPYAVDVASGVESSPGKKDHDRMRRFIAHVHAA